MELEFDTVVIEWRGPAPFLFAPLPEGEAGVLADYASALTYGWGCVPATATFGSTTVSTSLFPRHGGYLVPVKVAVQRAEGIGLGSEVHVRLRFDVP